MSEQVEIYTAEGIAVGLVSRVGHIRDLLEAGGSLRVDDAAWHPLDETPSASSPQLEFPLDDIHVATAEEAADLPVHAQWHDIVLDVGPYRVVGQMPTMPGFDPGRALARPTGEFMQLRDVTIGLLAEEGTGIERPMALVNRYVVDRVEADLMLGFFFPGAVMISTKPEEPVVVTSMPAPSTSSAPSGPTPAPAVSPAESTADAAAADTAPVVPDAAPTVPPPAA
jgi:hypothetical protein